MTRLNTPVELTEAELDAVTGGQSLVQGGLVNVGLSTGNISVLDNNNIPVNVDVPVTVRNVANQNNVSVGAIIQALGGGAAIHQGQAQA